MKFLPLQDFDNISSALTFDTVDCHVIGSCDLYTTKAAGGDKKLYKNIEHSLEAQHASLVRLSASLSPPHASSAAASLNLSRSSPFGPLSQISSRRTFAYLIATLNASHPDYDFSHILRPTDFRREKSLKVVVNALDTTLYNLRPRPSLSTSSPPSQWSTDDSDAYPSTPGGSQVWNPKMWTMIDKEMGLRDCSIYCYEPEQDPFDGEEGAIWSFHYFFFNKTKKRVCYIYLRGLSVASHSPVERPYISTPMSKSGQSGASKRANYWLGNSASLNEAWDDDEDEDDTIRLGASRRSQPRQTFDYLSATPTVDSQDEDADEQELFEKSRKEIRGISEDIADSMEV